MERLSMGSRSGALADVTVVDLTQMLSGPYATMMLADHGARVIKVEPPEGDMTRRIGFRGKADQEAALGAYFQSINRNKESVCLDLKSKSGIAALKRLIEKADVIVENYRHGVMERFGLGFEVLREINPRLVYGALRGFGDSRTGVSPYQEWPAFDVISQAMGGLMSITGPNPNQPTKAGPGVGDIVPGVMLAFGILAAVHHARRSGKGQFVDVAMTDAVLALCERIVWQHSVDGRVSMAEGNHHPFFCPFGIFPAADGFVAIAADSDRFFGPLCRALDAARLTEDVRFRSPDLRGKNRAELIALLEAVTAGYTRSELRRRLGGMVPFGPVMDIADIARDSHFAVRGMLAEVPVPGSGPLQVAGVPVKLSETPGGVHTRGPLLGEHTRSCLSEVGMSADEIDRLVGALPLITGLGHGT
jgi:crotonobetainyl-CoA:carnitine CoA-transferase CaiB-like acyl-CoA transferase